MSSVTVLEAAISINDRKPEKNIKDMYDEIST